MTSEIGRPLVYTVTSTRPGAWTLKKDGSTIGTLGGRDAAVELARQQAKADQGVLATFDERGKLQMKYDYRPISQEDPDDWEAWLVAYAMKLASSAAD